MRFQFRLATSAIALAICTGCAWPLTINIDEFQNDTVMLPFVPQQGTLSLCEDPSVLLSPVTCEAPASDTIVFLAGASEGVALLESDLPEPGTPAAPGDRVLLIPFPAPLFSVGEPGAENTTQTLLYTPALGQPGFALIEGAPVSYAITSDEVPETGSWLLLASGLVGVVLARWHGCDRIRRKTRLPNRHHDSRTAHSSCNGEGKRDITGRDAGRYDQIDLVETSRG